MPDVVVGRTALRRRIAEGTFRVIGVGGNIVDRMRPGIREQRLETVSEAMAVLGLQGLIVGVRAIPHQIKLAGEVGIRRMVMVLSHQLPARRTEVGDREDIGPSESSFHRRVPLIRSG